MTEFYIEYNPYTVECIFKKNGKVLGDNSKIGSKSDNRLQILLGESPNWKGLIEEIVDCCDDDQIDLSFRGRKIDYDDLRYAVDLFKGKAEFKMSFEETQNDSDVIAHLDSIFDEIKAKKLPEFEVKTAQGKDVFDAYEEVKNGLFEVSVIATMSSGKSTLINSLLHTELLPSENKACTATIARIIDNDEMDSFEAECYASDNQTVVYPKAQVDLDILKEYNSDPKVTFIDIEGSVPGIPSDKIKLCLRDTPGPNNSRDTNHERLTRSIIKRTNAVVLYVMNATQIGIKDDKQLLNDISSEMKLAGKQSRDRFIFVINKCDALDEEKGETLDRLINDVRDYLREFDIVDPTIIPTSARLALLIRKSRKGEKLSRKELQELQQIDDFVESDLLHFEEYASLTPTVKEKLRLKVSDYHKSEDDWDLEALIHTGVPAVEETICEYIDKYAYPMKINDAIKDIVGVLDELDMKSGFEKSIAKDKDQLEVVRKQISNAKKKHEEGKKISEQFKNRIGAFELDSNASDNEQKRVERELRKMSKEYDNQEKVDKTEATGKIQAWEETLNSYQKECEGKLNREIDVNLFKKGSEMLEDYSAHVRSILEDVKIDGFEFSKIQSFKQIKMDNVDQIIIDNETNRYRNEVRYRDNPERSGFWGKFKFWVPKKEEYTARVKDGVDVNVSEVVAQIMGTFSKSIKGNIKEMFNQADKQMADYKKTFIENVDNLDAEIERILQELEDSTAESKAIEKRVENNEQLSEWVSHKEEEIRTLLSF
ncbi:dynamin family protein [Butyrivibrio sp. INlla16]|uniref:dynamin family protein n=1 Tax=Butyrivibrio sp. INlla16 TaxID=1520807 RepID=UPI00087E9C62|nr:dynamin family protein [Butyrivibrio sp. INlla16]SDB13866.1 Dynamin family protein [Butyrivibrio sp. INlla16]